jgi:hypothetical protein
MGTIPISTKKMLLGLSQRLPPANRQRFAEIISRELDKLGMENTLKFTVTGAAIGVIFEVLPLDRVTGIDDWVQVGTALGAWVGLAGTPGTGPRERHHSARAGGRTGGGKMKFTVTQHHVAILAGVAKGVNRGAILGAAASVATGAAVVAAPVYWPLVAVNTAVVTNWAIAGSVAGGIAGGVAAWISQRRVEKLFRHVFSKCPA